MVRKYASSEPSIISGTEEANIIQSVAITFSVTGEGVLVGTTCKNALQGGMATVALRSTTKSGAPKVFAQAEDLQPGEITVNTVADVPAKLLCTADKLTIAADGSSYAVLTANIADSNDNFILSATNTISFEVSDENVLKEPLPAAASGGMATARIISTLTPGTATVTAASAGLNQGTIVLTAGRAAAPGRRVLQKKLSG